MPLTITIADNLDGTGAVATVAGSTAGSTNVVTVWGHSGAVGGLTSQATGSRTSDGTVALSLSNGAHFAICVSTLAGVSTVSSPVYFHSTTAGDSILWRILQVTYATLQGMTLSGYSASDVYVSKLPFDPKSPGANQKRITIHPTREAIERKLNSHDDYTFPVMVAMIWPSNQDATTNQRIELNNRQLVENAFKITPTKDVWGGAGTVPEVQDCIVVPGSVVLPEAFAQQLDVGAVVLNVVARLSR